jgi:hypothetical protein
MFSGFIALVFATHLGSPAISFFSALNSTHCIAGERFCKAKTAKAACRTRRAISALRLRLFGRWPWGRCLRIPIDHDYSGLRRSQRPIPSAISPGEPVSDGLLVSARTAGHPEIPTSCAGQSPPTRLPTYDALPSSGDLPGYMLHTDTFGINPTTEPVAPVWVTQFGKASRLKSTC